jgi:hypothetical protein
LFAMAHSQVVTQSTVGSFSGLSPAEQAAFDGTSKSLSGLLLGQLAIGVLGVLAITSEYSTGLPQPPTTEDQPTCRGSTFRCALVSFHVPSTTGDAAVSARTTRSCASYPTGRRSSSPCARRAAHRPARPHQHRARADVTGRTTAAGYGWAHQQQVRASWGSPRGHRQGTLRPLRRAHPTPANAGTSVTSRPTLEPRSPRGHRQAGVERTRTPRLQPRDGRTTTSRPRTPITHTVVTTQERNSHDHHP